MIQVRQDFVREAALLLAGCSILTARYLVAWSAQPPDFTTPIFDEPHVDLVVHFLLPVLVPRLPTGGAVAARHVWLQHLPEDQVPACGPSLEYMLENLPFEDTLSIVLMGDGNCAETVWTFMGLSIPEQTLILFIVATVICLWQTFRTYPQEA